MIRNFNGKDSSRYQTVFFDLDGTITDSAGGIIKGILYMLEKIGIEENDEKKIQAFLGPPMKQHLMKEYGLSDQRADKAYAYYREYYDGQGIYENRPFDGIKDAILAIKRSGKTVYIATSKPEPQALKVLDRFDLTNLFSEVFAARHDLGVSYKNEVLERALSLLGDTPNAVMVGDRHHDIHGGRHVGFDTVGVLYGYGDYDELQNAGCDYLIDSVQDLSSLLGGD